MHRILHYTIILLISFQHCQNLMASPGKYSLQQHSMTLVEADTGMMVRIAELEIFPEQLESYLTILSEEASASIRKEPGVLAIFPMSIKDKPAQIRIIEIYASKEAYQQHLKTPHFLHYKSSTTAMVKSLKLLEMQAIDPKTMQEIFLKMK